MARSRKWSDLSPRTRKAIKAAASVEGALKVIALVDLARRPASAVRGSKLGWTVRILTINSGGVVPVLYLLRGRKKIS